MNMLHRRRPGVDSRSGLSGEIATAPTASPAAARLASLDAYRGLIMLTLLCGGIFHSLAGHPIWGWLARHNEHVEWEGAVYWDLIQPAFMFMVGVAMPFAFAARAARGDTWGSQAGHALRRAAMLILIGVLLDHIGADRVQIGFMRVLQQIAFGYMVAFLVLGRSLGAQAIVVTAILVGYQALWTLNPWNGPGGPWAQGNENIGSAFDFWLLGRYYTGYYVGMNAIPSSATIILGVMAGQHVLASRDARRTSVTLLLAGLAMIAVGLAVSPWFPIIKRIWTPSFTVYSAGWTTLLLAAFYWAVEVQGWRRWAFPLLVVGMNSIAAYVIGNAFGGWFRTATRAWLELLAPALGPVWLPVLQRALFAATAWAVLLWLYRRRVFFKV
jgi:heparan-alpha-glucosaminide N-acetyltransferase